MKYILLLIRACLAILLAGIVSSVIVALVSIAKEMALDPSWGLDDYFGAVLTYTLFAGVIASFFGVIVAVLVEVPKLVVALRGDSPPRFWPQLLISTVGGAAIVVLGGVMLDMFGAPNTFLVTAAGVALGACSGLFWWLLVTKYALAMRGEVRVAEGA